MDVAVLEGAIVFGSVSALGAGLISIGIPEHNVIQYETALRCDKFLLVVHGTTADVVNAREILGGAHQGYFSAYRHHSLAH